MADLNADADSLDPALQVQQRVIPAHGAEPVATTAPNSVFALGGTALSKAMASAQTEARPVPAAEPRSTNVQRALALFDVHATLDYQQLAGMLNITRSAAAKLLHNMKARGLVCVVANHEAKGRSLFKRATSCVGTISGPHTAESLRASIAAMHPAQPGRITCGLLSSGELLIESGRQQMRLPPDHTQALIDYLATVRA